MHTESRYEHDPDFDDAPSVDDFDHEELLRAVAALRDDERGSDSDVQDLRSRRRFDEDADDRRSDDVIEEARRVRMEIAELMRTYEAALGTRRTPPPPRRPRRPNRSAATSRSRPERRDSRTRKALILMMLAELL